MSDVEIMRLTRSNANLLRNVAPAVFDEPVDPTRTAAYVETPGHFMLVAVCENTVFAQAAGVIHRHPDKCTELYIDEVGVAEEFRRKGLASHMVSELFTIGREMGCEEAWVGTEDDNVPARRLYESLGNSAPEPFVMYVYDLMREDS